MSSSLLHSQNINRSRDLIHVLFRRSQLIGACKSSSQWICNLYSACYNEKTQVLQLFSVYTRYVC